MSAHIQPTTKYKVGDSKSLKKDRMQAPRPARQRERIGSVSDCSRLGQSHCTAVEPHQRANATFPTAACALLPLGKMRQSG